MAEPPAHIFICYARPDRELARALKRALADEDRWGWLDDEDLVPGDPWDTGIAAALDGAAMVAVLISAHWQPTGTHYAPDEVARAIDLARERRLRVVPITLVESRPSGLPYGLARIKDIDGRGEDWPDIARRLSLALDDRTLGDYLGRPQTVGALKTPADPSLPTEPYPLLSRYAHPAHFAGRDRELADVRALLSRPETRVLLLRAISGAGKSSLLEAGLVPALRGEGVPVALVRSPDKKGLAQRVLAQLLDPAPAVKDYDAPAIAAAFARVTELAGAPPVIVLDQFEEVFKQPDAASRATARARVGFLLAAAAPLDGTARPTARWVLSYRDDYHGEVGGWLPLLLAAARADGWPVDNLIGGDGFARDDRCVQTYRLEPLGGAIEGHRFEPPEDIADDAIAAAFLAAIRAPAAVDGVGWTLALPDDGPARLARAFAEARRARPDDPLAPELQVVLRRCLIELAPGRFELRVPEQVGDVITDALRAHLRGCIAETARAHRRHNVAEAEQATLEALSALTLDGRRRNAPVAEARLLGRIGPGASDMLRDLAGTRARVLIAEHPDAAGRALAGEGDAPPVYRLSHDRLAAAVDSELAAVTAAADDRDYAKVADLVRRRADSFEADDADAANIGWRQRRRVKRYAARLIDDPARLRWWGEVDRRARRSHRLALSALVLVVIAAWVGWSYWESGRRDQRITDRLTAGEPGPVLLAVVDVIARDGTAHAAHPHLPALGDGQNTPGRAFMRSTLAEAFPDMPAAAECAARGELVDHYRPQARWPEDFGALLAAAQRMARLPADACGARAADTRRSVIEALGERYPAPDDGWVASLGWRPIPPTGADAVECTIGSPEDEPGRDSDEAQRTVTLSRYEVMATEVTVGQMQAFLAAGGLNWQPQPVPGVADASTLPATTFDWYQATAFAAWVGGRLPTEAEWECAARAGAPTPYWWGAGDEALAQSGWYSGNSGGAAHPVAQKPANPWGLFDVHGNAFEWTADWYAAARPPAGARDPLGPAGGEHRVLRGGSFASIARSARSASRNGDRPDTRVTSFGFRVARPTPALDH